MFFQAHSIKIFLILVIGFSALTFSTSSFVEIGLSKASAQGKKKVNFKAAKKQAMLYFRKKMTRQARQQLDLAYSVPEGKKDYVILYYRGFIARQDLRLEVAFDMIEKAIAVSEEGTTNRKNAQTLMDEMKSKFGAVILEKGKDNLQDKGRVFLRTYKNKKIFNKEKRKQFASIQARFNTVDVQLPAKIYLPYGKYTANYVEFAIKKKKKAQKIQIPFISAEKKLEEDNTWLYASIGAGAVAVGILTYFVLDDGENTSSVTFTFNNEAGK